MSDRVFNISDRQGRDVAVLRRDGHKVRLIPSEDGNFKAAQELTEILNGHLHTINREADKKRTSRKSISMSCITQSDVQYPRDIFDDLIMGENSPYAFYLFGWIDYHGEDCGQWRLKLAHDIELNDGTIMLNMRPNADAWWGNGRAEDKDVKRIRISKNQHFSSKRDGWTKPKPQPMELV